MIFTRRLVAFSVGLLLVFPLVGIHAQQVPQTVVVGPQYTNIVVFGDSLSDTGNDTNLSFNKYGLAIPGPIADYTLGRFTDGTDTAPAATNYTGTWVEQMAAQMPNHPAVANSLSGGSNYAYGYAFTGSGTTNLVLTTSPITLSVTVDNVGQQIANYLATNPTITNKTLFVLWGGANDVLNATTGNDIVNATTNETLNIYSLVQAGATQFLVLNMPPLGSTPRLNTSSTYSPLFNLGSIYFNQLFAKDIGILEGFIAKKHVSIYLVDVFSLFNQVIASPSSYGLTNVTSSSQGVIANPDNYLFWDSIHPTTHGHSILANAALNVLAGPPCNAACPTSAPASPAVH